MLDNPAADVATGPSLASSSSIHPAASHSGRLTQGGTSSYLDQRGSSRREDSTSSDFFSTSTINSSQLFVKIPSLDTHSVRSPRSSTRPEEIGPERPPPRSPYRPFPVKEEEESSDDDFLPIQKPWTVRPRTLSSGEPATRRVGDSSRGRQACSEDGVPRRGQRPRVLSLPRQAFRTGSNSDSSEQPSPLTPSAFNDIPPMPIFARNRRYKHQPRDSGVTHQSTTSSSLYPRSSSTGESYLSPPSLPPNDIDDRHIITVDPEENPHEHELHEMDADDVSYRLRLLMQNNYYLPPAHSKPFNDYPFPETPKKSSAKPSSPNFLDLFKMGKKKAGAPDPKVSKVPSAPILRTTSDQSTVSGLVRPRAQSRPVQPHPHAMAMTMAPHALTIPQPRPDPASKGRVVVVRERMEDIATVARQVEQDLKIKQRVAEAERRIRKSEDSPSTEELPIHDGLIDPTDSVDLPPLSANAFFGPQASALNALGVEASVGAAALADRLVPVSPGLWSVESEEERWRKALLQEAVGHSLSNSPAATPARGTPSGSSPFLATEAPATPSPAPLSPRSRSHSSSRPGGSPAPIVLENGNGGEAPVSAAAPESDKGKKLAVPRRKRELGQRIISSHMIDDANLEDPGQPPLSPLSASNISMEAEPRLSSSVSQTRSLRVSSAGSFVPIRAETPTVPPTPLAPAPRRPNATPGHSSDSQPDNGQKSSMETISPGQSGPGHLQVSTENITRLSDVYESQAFGGITPPLDSLDSQHNSVTLSAVLPAPGITVSSRSPSISSSSRYSSYDEQGDTAFHTPLEHTITSFDGSRPSLTVSSVRSSSEYSQQSPTTSAFRDAFDHSPFPDGRHSVANTLGNRSRNSSRSSNHEDPHYSVVSPPPRTSSSLAHTALHPPPRRLYVPMPRTFDHISEHSRSLHEFEDEPRTPTGQLRVPMSSMHTPVTGADIPAYPPSPISFFDAVEMQSGAEDDNSEEEEEEEEELQDDDPTEQVDEYQGDAETGMLIVDPISGSVGNISRDPKLPLAGIAQSSTFSTPQVGSGSLPSGSSYRETSSTLVHDTLESRLPMPGPPPSASSRSTFSLKGKGKAPMAQLPPNPPRISESMVERMRPKQDFIVDNARRPATASAATPRRPEGTAAASVLAWQEEQSQQDQTTRRLDGMLIEHMERERDILRRITTTLTKP